MFCLTSHPVFCLKCSNVHPGMVRPWYWGLRLRPRWHWSCSGLRIVITITAWSHSGLTRWRNSGLLTLCWAHWSQPWLPAPGVARLRPETSPGQEQLTMGRPGQWDQPSQPKTTPRPGPAVELTTLHDTIPFLPPPLGSTNHSLGHWQTNAERERDTSCSSTLASSTR